MDIQTKKILAVIFAVILSPLAIESFMFYPQNKLFLATAVVKYAAASVFIYEVQSCDDENLEQKDCRQRSKMIATYVLGAMSLANVVMILQM